MPRIPAAILVLLAFATPAIAQHTPASDAAARALTTFDECERVRILALAGNVTPEAGATIVLRACAAQRAQAIQATERWIATQPEARRADLRRDVEDRHLGPGVVAARIRRYRGEIASQQAQVESEASAEAALLSALRAFVACVAPRLQALPADVVPEAGVSRAVAGCAAERQRMVNLGDTATVGMREDRRAVIRERIRSVLAHNEGEFLNALQRRSGARNR